MKFHKESFRGRVKDFQISFNEEQKDIDSAIQVSLELFRQLINSFQNANVLVRFIAKVNFFHVNPLTNEVTERSYHFCSDKTESVYDVDEFYQRHMRKIVQRLDNFNVHGSNLLIKNIAHIHVQCTII